jgi:hypothetical protein
MDVSAKLDISGSFESVLCWKAGCSENCLSGLERAGRKRTPARVQRAALPLYAITYLRSGADIFTLKALLGHGSLDMVEHYARIAEVDVEQAHRRASPADNWRL